MPIYEYKCRKCDHVFEKWAKNFDAAPKCPRCPAPVKVEDCPLCHGVNWKVCSHGHHAPGHKTCGGRSERLVSGGGFQLKGGGWAEDGY